MHEQQFVHEGELLGCVITVHDTICKDGWKKDNLGCRVFFVDEENIGWSILGWNFTQWINNRRIWDAPTAFMWAVCFEREKK